MGLKEFFKPSWIKVIFFFILVIPVSLVLYPITSLSFMLFALITVKLIRYSSPSFTVDEGFLILFPLIFNLFINYIVSCVFGLIYNKMKKSNAKRFLYGSIIVAVIFIAIIGVIIFPYLMPRKIIKESPAPGCIEYKWGAPSFGGCFGKSIITDLDVGPEISCMDVHVNNCNGGMLTIYNRCSYEIRFDGLTIESKKNESDNSDIWKDLELARDDSGNVIVRKTRGNYASYLPVSNETLKVNATVGNQSFTISYTKTKELC